MFQMYVVLGLILIGIVLIFRRIDFEALSPEQQICMGCMMEHGGCPVETFVASPVFYCRLIGSNHPKDVI